MAETGRIFQLFCGLTFTPRRVNDCVFNLFGGRLAIDEKTLVFLRERIVGFAQSRIGRDTAEDLAQETLMLLTSKYADLEKVTDLLPVAIRVMQFKAMDKVGSKTWTAERTKSDPVDLPLPSPEPSPYDQIEAKETAERLAATFKFLGPECRKLMRLRYVGKSTHEIQAIMGIENTSTTNVRIKRCYDRWRKLMAEAAGGLK
jgi:RNA polymerase sigma-70 factor (ECF subfamily)